MARTCVEIMDAVRKSGNKLSKKDIQYKTGIPWGTMYKNVNALIESGFLLPLSEGASGRGRPMIPLAIDPSAGYYVGMDAGTYEIKLIITDLCFQIIHRETAPAIYYTSDQAFCQALCTLVQKCIANSGIPSCRVLGAGIAISGMVDSEAGLLYSAMGMGVPHNQNIPIAKFFEENLGLPTYIISTSSSATWGEYQFGRWAGCGNLVTVVLGNGIGSGILANHDLLITRPRHRVGYIGHMLMPGNDQQCVCGLRGCLSAYSGGRSLGSVAMRRFPERTDLCSAHSLDLAAANGDANACEIMCTAAQYNAIGIINILQCYLPDILIFSGGQVHPDGFLYQQTLKALENSLPYERRKNLKIGISSLGKFQSALGASHLAFQNNFFLPASSAAAL